MVRETAGSPKTIWEDEKPSQPSFEVFSSESRRIKAQRGRTRLSGWRQGATVSVIIKQLGVMGGSPVIGGTRIRISDIVRHQALRGDSIGDIRRALPHLTQGQIRAALQYYGEHRAEIDAEIETERGLAASAGENPSG